MQYPPPLPKSSPSLPENFYSRWGVWGRYDTNNSFASAWKYCGPAFASWYTINNPFHKRKTYSYEKDDNPVAFHRSDGSMQQRKHRYWYAISSRRYAERYFGHLPLRYIPDGYYAANGYYAKPQVSIYSMSQSFVHTGCGRYGKLSFYANDPYKWITWKQLTCIRTS